MPTNCEIYDSRPWLQHYPENAGAEIEAFHYPNLAGFVTQASADGGDEPAFTTCLPKGTSGRLSFTDVGRLSDAFAVWLREVQGCQPGDRIAVQLPNCLAYPVALFGIFKAGCVVVNVNPLYTAPEMIHQLNDSKAKILLQIDLFADKLDEVIPHTQIKTVVQANVADFFPGWKRFYVRNLMKVARMLPSSNMATLSLQKVISAGQERIGSVDIAAYHADVGLDDLAALQYTGGTTGVSKGAELTHRNIISNVEQAMEMGRELWERPDQRMITPLPIYHAFGLFVSLLGFIQGSENVLIPNPRPADNMRKAFENFPPTAFCGLNTLFVGLLDADWFQQLDLSQLDLVVSGGMALHDDTAERWKAKTGHDIYQGYGLTETSPVASTMPFGGLYKRGSIGIPYPSTVFRILDENGQCVPAGEVGEIAIRGPQVMRGYLDRPEETTKVMTDDGFFCSGDMGYMDDDGYFFVVDRKKDMILVSGFNVYPNEIEDVLAKHPKVEDVGVIGIPDAKSDEAVCACVVLRDGAELSEEELIIFARESLTNYKAPRKIVFMDELPLTPVGKVLRKDLRTQVLQTT